MINLSNAFLVCILLNNVNIHRVVIANDKKEAISILDDYYMDFSINYVFSYDEIGNIVQECYKESDLDFYLCIEISGDEKDNIVFNTFYERTDNIAKLKEKYKDKYCFFYNAEYIHALAHHAESEFNHSTRKPLISENISL